MLHAVAVFFIIKTRFGNVHVASYLIQVLPQVIFGGGGGGGQEVVNVLRNLGVRLVLGYAALQGGGVENG